MGIRDRDDGDRATIDDGSRKMADTNDRGKDRDTYAEVQMTEIWQTEISMEVLDRDRHRNKQSPYQLFTNMDIMLFV